MVLDSECRVLFVVMLTGILLNVVSPSIGIVPCHFITLQFCRTTIYLEWGGGEEQSWRNSAKLVASV